MKRWANILMTALVIWCAMAAVGTTTGCAESEQPVPDVPHEMKIGMNLSGVTYWSRAWVFTDLMKMSDAWRGDNRGYIFKAGGAPTGQYVCTWGGSGSVRFSGDVAARPTGSNSAKVTVRPGDEGINMQKVGDVTRVTLMKQAYETRVSPFDPTFIERTQPFGVIRFMDWGKTNGSPIEHWRQRPHKSDMTQTGGGGVAIEYMIDLCNELHADPWFCIPHGADDDYVRQFAELVKKRLHKDATVYVEYSNEVWNSMFSQHKYIQDKSDGKTYSPAFFDAWAKRCRNTFDIWTDVFGDEADIRLVRVAAVHLQNPWAAEQLLPKLDGKFDAISPAAYFGVTYKQTQTFTAQTTVDELLDVCEKNIRHDNRAWYQKYGAMTKQWSKTLGRPIRLVAYEAGQHLTANGNDQIPYYDILIRAQSDPRMHELYLLNMQLFEAAGGDLYVAFNDVSRPGKHGSWGHMAYQDQPIEDAPKYKALLDYMGMKDKAGLESGD